MLWPVIGARRQGVSVRTWGGVAAVILSAVVSGCSRSASSRPQKPVHPVRGQLLVGGQPAVGAFVFLVPVDEPPDPTEPRPRAEVGKDGSFEVSMYGDRDGAPVGEYIVTVLWEGEGGYDRLKGQYSDAKRSKLRASIKPGHND